MQTMHGYGAIMINTVRFLISRSMMAFVAGVLMLAVPSAGISQTCPLSLQVSHTAATQLSLADVDFEHFPGNNLLFTLNIANAGGAPATAAFQITLDIVLADHSIEFNNPVLTYSSQDFTVPTEGRTITNMSIGRNAQDIKTKEFNFQDQAKNQLKDISLGTGTLPAGTYTFHVMLVNCGSAVSQDVPFILQNPTHVELRSPRDGETTNVFPLFEFFQDGNRAELVVAEKNPDQSREDAITRVPPMLDVDLTGQNSFPYAGGRPLEEGKTYVWQVTSKVLGSGGKDIGIASPIWQFTVSSSPQGDAAEDVILSQLEEMFGKRYPGIFEQIRKQGFALTGSYTLNNSTLSKNALLDLLNQLREVSESADVTFQ
jgi:hypothetical protein